MGAPLFSPLLSTPPSPPFRPFFLHNPSPRLRGASRRALPEVPPGATRAGVMSSVTQRHLSVVLPQAVSQDEPPSPTSHPRGLDKAHADRRFYAALSRVGMSVLAALLFGVFTLGLKGQEAGLAYFAAYLVEQSLSVDNLFVFIMLFQYFKVPLVHQNRVLTWGVVGAVLMRGFMIAVGVAAVNNFRWIILVFAAILMFSSVKMLQEEEAEEDLSKNAIVKISQRLLGNVSDRYDGDKFFTTHAGQRAATPLLLCLVCIEISDFVFAVDSIPAVLGVSHDPFIVYTSNIFAIIALRSLYTLVARAVSELPYLKHAVALVLFFIGSKMLAEFFGYEVSTGTSLAVVVFLLVGGVLLSVGARWWSRKRGKKRDPGPVPGGALEGDDHV